MADGPQLLFCDTFNHDAEELNLDVVSFPCPVHIHEARIIPQGTWAHRDLPEDKKYGKTHPSAFDVDLFAINLNKSTAAVFDTLGSFKYNAHSSIQLTTNPKISTDRVAVKGWYTALTLALYGTLTESTGHDDIPPPPPSQPQIRTQTRSGRESSPRTQSRDSYPERNRSTERERDSPRAHRHRYEDLESRTGRSPRRHSPGPHSSRDRDRDRDADSVSSQPSLTVTIRQGPRTPPGPPPPDSDEEVEEPKERTRDEGREREREGRDSRDRKASDRSSESREREGRERESRDRDRERESRTSRDRESRSSREREPRDREKERREKDHEEEASTVQTPDVTEGKGNQELFEPLTPEHSPGEQHFNLSDGEINDTEEQAGRDPEAYEEILSEEEGMEDEDGPAEASAEGVDIFSYTTEEPWLYLTSITFNPYQCDLGPLVTFSSPEKTRHELELAQLEQKEPEERHESADKMVEQVEAIGRSDDRGPKWVQTLEEVQELVTPGLAHLQYQGLHKDYLCTLYEWTLHGLEVDTALTLPIAINLRLLKASMRMVAALCECGPEVAAGLIRAGIQDRLFTLLFAEHMSSSLKLAAIKALDSTISCQEGVERLLGWHQEEEGKPSSGYQQLINLMLGDQTVRVVTAATALVRKASLYETITTLQSTADHIVETTQIPDLETEGKVETSGKTEDSDKAGLKDEDDDEDVAMDTAMSPLEQVQYSANMQDIETVINCLEELCTIVRDAVHIIAQPHPKAFPTSAVLTGHTTVGDPYPVIYHYFTTRRLLECLVVLVSSPSTAAHPGILNAIKDLMTQLMLTQKGLLYLASHYETVNVLIRVLTQSTEYDREDSSMDTTAQDLGLKLIYHLQALQAIDQLQECINKGCITQGELDSAELLSTLHTMFSMTFTSLGRASFVHVLGLETNLTCLLAFVESTGDEDTDNNLRKSVCFKYACVLLLLTVQGSDNVDMLEKYAQRLLTVCEQAPDANPKLIDIRKWLQPVKGLTFDLSSICGLVELVKVGSDELDLNRLNVVGPSVTTSLRILKHLCCPPANAHCGQKDLKWNLSVIQLFSANAMEIFIIMLQKLGTALLHPWRRGHPHPGTQAAMVIAMVTSALAVVKTMLAELLGSGSVQFRDVRLLKSLLTLHTVLCSAPTTGTFIQETQRVQTDVIDVFLTFTQPPVTQKSDSEEALGNTTWSMMLKEVLQYIMSAPEAFLGGLTMLSELLPLPLPMGARESLSPDDVILALNNRKLWSAYLHIHSSELQQVIKALAGSGCSQLQQLLKRVCWQMADLAAPTSLMVVRSLFDIVLDSINTNEKGREESRPVDKPCSANTLRLLELVEDLMSQAPIKAPALHLLRSGAKSDEKYLDLLYFLCLLMNVVSDQQNHLQATDCVVSIFQSMCDPDITLTSPESGASLLEQKMKPNQTLQLANSLPGKDHLLSICTTLLDHVSSEEQTFGTILQALRTIVMLSEHDYGFYTLKSALKKSTDCLYKLLKRLASTFNKDNADHLAVISTTFELLRVLLTIDEEMGAAVRTMVLSGVEMRELLNWSDEPEYPLHSLEKHLTECCKEDESLESLMEATVNLRQSIQASEEQELPKELEEPALPPPEQITDQFNSRAIYLVGDEYDERSVSPTFWLSSPPPEDADIEADMVKCDLIDMSQKFLNDFDVKAELEKDITTSTGAPTPPGKAARKRLNKPRVEPMVSWGGRGPIQRHGNAPMRGKGYSIYSRGMAFQSRPNDVFRQRKQNTSRPPSMHVDDFLAMEDDTGPPAKRTRQNESSNRGGGSGRGGFGRGRGGFRGNHGPEPRWLSPPGQYGRRGRGTLKMGNMQDKIPNLDQLQGSRTQDHRETRPRSAEGNPTVKEVVQDVQSSLPNLDEMAARDQNHEDTKRKLRVPSMGNIQSRGNQWGGRDPPQQHGGFGHRGFGRGHDSRPPGPPGSPGGYRGREGWGRLGRGGGGGGRGMRGGHWSGPREKDNNQRFLPPPSPGYSRGRDRHARSFTR
ncbi:protein virilizer homolog isoform X2 [Branchiostoma lanceolatum]|uniref:protein virilizer homolog isoform X2 n=1 Tax=Branchiostoma lanceolatum TaxID=7740 RepID=UPI003453FCD9